MSLLKKNHKEQTSKIQEILRNDPRLASVSGAGGCNKTCCTMAPNGVTYCSLNDCDVIEN